MKTGDALDDRVIRAITGLIESEKPTTAEEFTLLLDTILAVVGGIVATSGGDAAEVLDAAADRARILTSTGYNAKSGTHGTPRFPAQLTPANAPELAAELQRAICARCSSLGIEPAASNAQVVGTVLMGMAVGTLKGAGLDVQAVLTDVKNGALTRPSAQRGQA